MAPAAKWNVRQIRAEAHKLSRQGNSLNPFRLTFSKGEENRRETWDGSRSRDIEATAGSYPLEQARTEPNPFTTRTSDVDEDGERKNAPGSSKDFEARDGEHRRSAHEGGSNTTHASQNSMGGTSGTGVESQNGIVRFRSMGREPSSEPSKIPEGDESKKLPKKHAMFKSVQPKEPFTVANQIQRTLLNSWINILILAAPAGIALGFVPNINGIITFVVNFIAIVPLAAMLSFATEEIALRTGETLGGLLNATFGNAVELIVAIIALTKKEVTIVQTSLIGSILSNLLLVMGMCFFFGGLNRPHQNFNETVAQTAASLLALAVAGVIVPSVFDLNVNTPGSDVSVAELSRGTSVILLIVYGGYLYFQLKTHSEIFAQESQKVPTNQAQNGLKDGAISQGLVQSAGVMGATHGLSRRGDNEKLREMLMTPPHDIEDEEDPQLHFWVAVATLTGSTVIIALCAEFMVDGISAVTAGGVVSEEFVGLILLPIVGNAAEHATAVTVAVKDKMDLAIGVAVGSSMQVALFIIPLVVIIGWGMGLDNMSLSFDIFQVAVLFVAVLLVNYLIADGKSHWLEGMLLMALYIIIAVCSWWYPATGVVG